MSRVTVRAAIQRLPAIGLVEVKYGKGTYGKAGRDLRYVQF